MKDVLKKGTNAGLLVIDYCAGMLATAMPRVFLQIYSRLSGLKVNIFCFTELPVAVADVSPRQGLQKRRKKKKR